MWKIKDDGHTTRVTGVPPSRAQTIAGRRNDPSNVPGGVTGKVTGAAKPSGTQRHPPGIVTRAVAAAECRWLLEPATECYVHPSAVGHGEDVAACGPNGPFWPGRSRSNSAAELNGTERDRKWKQKGRHPWRRPAVPTSSSALLALVHFSVCERLAAGVCALHHARQHFSISANGGMSATDFLAIQG